MAPSLQDWLVEFVRFFRALGVYANYASMSDVELAGVLQQWHEVTWNGAVNPTDPIADLRLLYADEERVWWGNLTAGVGMGQNAYIGVLQAWGRISRGYLQPEEISEQWDGEQGPIALSFLYQDEKVRVYPQYDGESVDLGVLLPINRLIENQGIQFCLYERFNETAFLIALTPEEKARLETERGWHFEI